MVVGVTVAVTMVHEGAKPIVKIHLAKGARLPTKATEGSAAFDVFACLPIDQYVSVSPGDRLLIPTGLYFEIPQGYFISLRPRSGLALKSGLTLPNTPATIDSDYRGELKVAVINLSQESVEIKSGDRIAQLLLERSVDFAFQEEPSMENLSPTERGQGGFGSTGIA